MRQGEFTPTLKILNLKRIIFDKDFRYRYHNERIGVSLVRPGINQQLIDCFIAVY